MEDNNMNQEVEIIDLPPVEANSDYVDTESSGYGTLAAGVGVCALAVVGLGSLVSKGAQKVYQTVQIKRDKPIQLREKWYQIHRPKVVWTKEEKEDLNPPIVDIDSEENPED